MITKKDGEAGFSLLELSIVMLILALLVTVVILLASGFFGEARKTGLETDLRGVKTAVDVYVVDSLSVPTADGQLPPPGEYALIDFDASFTQEGKTLTFYPDYLEKLPKHHDEGVWRIDSHGVVSVDMATEDY